MKSGIAATLLLALLAAPVLAQVNDGKREQFRERAGAKLAERFRQADANGDGRLTRDEAKGKMPRVYENFTRIDSSGKGYVSEDELRRFAAEQLAERKAASGS